MIIGCWTKERREQLELLLKEGFTLKAISEIMNVSTTTIRTELQAVLDKDEYKNRQYIKYTAEAAIEKDIRILKGEL